MITSLLLAFCREKVAMSKLADNPPATHKAGGGGGDGDGYTKEESWKISVTVPAVMVEKEPKNVLHYSLPEVDLTKVK